MPLSSINLVCVDVARENKDRKYLDHSFRIPLYFFSFLKTLLLPPSPAFLPESGFSLSHFTFTDENESPRFDLTAL